MEFLLDDLITYLWPSAAFKVKFEDTFLESIKVLHAIERSNRLHHLMFADVTARPVNRHVNVFSFGVCDHVIDQMTNDDLAILSRCFVSVPNAGDFRSKQSDAFDVKI